MWGGGVTEYAIQASGPYIFAFPGVLAGVASEAAGAVKMTIQRVKPLELPDNII